MSFMFLPCFGPKILKFALAFFFNIESLEEINSMAFMLTSETIIDSTSFIALSNSLLREGIKTL